MECRSLVSNNPILKHSITLISIFCEQKKIFMRIIRIHNPPKLVFGRDSFRQFVDDFTRLNLNRLLLIITPQVLPMIESMKRCFRRTGIDVKIIDMIVKEPTIDELENVLQAGIDFKIDSVVGIGGGSVLDVAKLIAALHGKNQKIQDVFGIGLVRSRSCYLACLPTTSGTGSEVSPNAILYDPVDRLKKGVVSPFLVPDAAYIDPDFTRTVPPSVTAATGMDALTHCIEAYANRFAHPMIDLYALEGIRLISQNLQRAVIDGDDMEAREKLSQGSLYGGMCLGPVNTAAVHALAYPLGSEFHIAHGVSNALLLPHLMEFNMSAEPNRYAKIAEALGVTPLPSPYETAKAGVEKIRTLAYACGVPSKLSDLKIPEQAIEDMAKSAITITRLLNNNLRAVTLEDAKQIYLDAY